MLKSLYRSERVQKEIQTFTTKISLIQNQEARNKAKNLLEHLKQKIQDLDEGHRSYLLGEVRPSLMTFVKDEITSTRKEIARIIKENS
jgi:hypothetical protein